ncbi:MAG: NAD(P)-dependent oxidoreductase [Bacteroidota bacterium]
MAYKVLLTHRIPVEGLKALVDDFELKIPDNSHFSEQELADLIPEYDALIPVFGFKIGQELIEKGKKLKIIANFGAGYNNIDMKTATEKNIMVTNTPRTVIEPTAELAFALMLSLVRRVAEFDRKIKHKEEIHWEVMANLGHTLEGKTLGIIGMGNIGKSMALKAKAFGMNTLYHRRNPLGYTDESAYSAHYMKFEELLRKSDIISLHTPLTDDTHHLLDEKEFMKMKKGAFVVNTARGAVIHEKALIRYLRNGHLGGAALDVHEFEPSISEELLNLANVLLVPHIGTASYETRKAMAEEAANNIDRFFKGVRPPNLVNPEVNNK